VVATQQLAHLHLLARERLERAVHGVLNVVALEAREGLHRGGQAAALGGLAAGQALGVFLLLLGDAKQRERAREGRAGTG